jgi:uncharacterized protein (DUF1810 family)
MNPSSANDPFHLKRFLEAQDKVFDAVSSELQRGRKETHWMWFVFPQIAGLGLSPTAQFFAIQSADEARAYLQHPILGSRLRQCVDLVLRHANKSASEIFGFHDDLKLRSSMTLFAAVSNPGSVFHRALEQFFNREWDENTLKLL